MSRFKITVPELYPYRLRAWASLKGTNRGTLAGNLVQARVEANWPEVDKDLDELAKLRGLTREELNKEIEKND